MKTTVNFILFSRQFFNMSRGETFSYEGLKALFEYLQVLEEETTVEMELDVISLCCDFTEYSSLGEFHVDYDSKEYPDIESISMKTTVIKSGGDSFIIQNF